MPAEVTEACGATRSAQLRTLITDIVQTTAATGLVGLSEAGRRVRWPPCAASTTSASTSARTAGGRPAAVIDMLRALVEHYSGPPRRPARLGPAPATRSATPSPTWTA